MKLLYRIAAEVVLIIHIFIILIVLFGWLIPDLWYFYIATLGGTLASELLLKYCFLHKWEFELRKRVNPRLRYDYSFTSYYTYKLTRHHLSNTFVWWAATTFVAISILINLYFKFFFIT